ncbi:MAG: hypothetical protein HOW73_43990 [Polyangiaceae bacterium]|nr:hypothetical protein [Polyangiaceae bacterium]
MSVEELRQPLRFRIVAGTRWYSTIQFAAMGTGLGGLMVLLATSSMTALDEYRASLIAVTVLSVAVFLPALRRGSVEIDVEGLTVDWVAEKRRLSFDEIELVRMSDSAGGDVVGVAVCLRSGEQLRLEVLAERSQRAPEAQALFEVIQRALDRSTGGSKSGTHKISKQCNRVFRPWKLTVAEPTQMGATPAYRGAPSDRSRKLSVSWAADPIGGGVVAAIVAAVSLAMGFVLIASHKAEWATCLLAVAGLIVGYACARAWSNRSTVSVSGASLSVNHGPLPPCEAAVSLGAGSIERLVCEHVSELAGRQSYNSYRLVAELKSGEHVTLLSDVTEPATARWLEWAIAEALGIEERAPVSVNSNE